MFLKILPDLNFKTLSFRLTFSYSVMLVIVALIGFLSLYLCLKQFLYSRIDNELIGDYLESATVIAIGAVERAQDYFDEEMETDSPDFIFLHLLNPDGTTAASTDMRSWRSPELESFTTNAPAGRPSLNTIEIRDHENTARVITGELPNGMILQIGFLIDDELELLESIRLYSLFILLCIAAAAILIGRNISSIAVKGINDVTRTANRIAEGEIRDRVTVSNYGVELENLGNTFNRMADRLSYLLNEMKEVNDNIAHDLRSPLARMRGLAEEKITNKNASEDCLRVCEDVIEECDILLHIINTMLDISEMESDLSKMVLETFDLKTILEQAVETFQPVAEDNNITFHTDIHQSIKVNGDRRKIQRSISNLIDNALKYTAPQGEITVELSTENGFAKIVVKDTGIGIADADCQKIFQRFYRGSRSRNLPGNGLGLSLAHSVARAHGGGIHVKSKEGIGSEFSFTLPAFQ